MNSVSYCWRTDAPQPDSLGFHHWSLKLVPSEALDGVANAHSAAVASAAKSTRKDRIGNSPGQMTGEQRRRSRHRIVGTAAAFRHRRKRRYRVGRFLRERLLQDFGAAGTSGALVTGVPASVSAATKFTRSSTSLPLRPALASNV